MSSRVRVRRNGSAVQVIRWPTAGEVCAPAAAEGALAQPALTPPSEKAHVTEEALREARQAAFREGKAAGRVQSQAEIGPVLKRLAHTVEELAALRPRLRQQAEADLVRLAVAIARRVVRRELTVDPQAIQGLVSAALEQLASEETVRLRVHPDDAAAVRACVSRTGRAAGVTVAGDAALERGSAIFETARGNLDASAETQLAEIERGLTDRFRSGR